MDGAWEVGEREVKDASSVVLFYSGKAGVTEQLKEEFPLIPWQSLFWVIYTNYLLSSIQPNPAGKRAEP